MFSGLNLVSLIGVVRWSEHHTLPLSCSSSPPSSLAGFDENLTNNASVLRSVSVNGEKERTHLSILSEYVQL